MTDRDLEMKTILQWDRTGGTADFYTADPSEARRWQRLGYPVASARGRDARARREPT